MSHEKHSEEVGGINFNEKTKAIFVKSIRYENEYHRNKNLNTLLSLTLWPFQMFLLFNGINIL